MISLGPGLGILIEVYHKYLKEEDACENQLVSEDKEPFHSGRQFIS